MHPYYQHYSVSWELNKIQEQIESLENWDVLYNEAIVGAIRLAYDEDGCYLRDLQVSEKFQNKGIGAAALSEVQRLACKAEVAHLRLRVFKISPAYELYKRTGFTVDKEDDRFYYMSKSIAI
ncbi:GNAT family N-acetyltransferase [Vibrio sinensis]|uniref:GNAT family N-acetyltransferase n=2 Tax=Vibrio sinensis TaxID=2302434 RepID=A0A3A6QK66_9VIBR|nr:GNAT family N-acetyltransferase [Vibrio sinensis]